jgi:hypothetical protein
MLLRSEGAAGELQFGLWAFTNSGSPQRSVREIACEILSQTISRRTDRSSVRNVLKARQPHVNVRLPQKLPLSAKQHARIFTRNLSQRTLLSRATVVQLNKEVRVMRNWLVGLVALTGTALAAAPVFAQGMAVAPDYGPNFYDDGDDVSYYGPGYTPPPYAYWGPPRATTSPTPPPGYRPAASSGFMYYNAPATAAPAAPAARPGQCETFFYWSDGRCVDARLR